MKKPIAENGFTYVDDIIPELPDFLEKISKNRESNIDKEIRTGDIGHTEFIGSDHIPTTTGTFGDDKIIGDDYSSSVEVINAGDGDDIVYGNEGTDSIVGEFGNDLIKGGGGDDVIAGDHGHDELYGGSGDDSIWGGFGRDFVSGGSGRDNLWGGFGDDFLFGGAGDDLLHGGAGNDELDAGSGNDILVGGAGSDTFIFSSTSGVDVVLDFDNDDSIIINNAIGKDYNLYEIEGSSRVVLEFESGKSAITFYNTHVSDVSDALIIL